jgi:hypothetical protein
VASTVPREAPDPIKELTNKPRGCDEIPKTVPDGHGLGLDRQPGNAQAATITVTTLGTARPWTTPTAPFAAIISANTDSNAGEDACTDGFGTDKIVLPIGTILLTGAAGEDAAASGDLDITGDARNHGGSGLSIINGGANDRVRCRLTNNRRSVRTHDPGRPSAGGVAASILMVSRLLQLSDCSVIETIRRPESTGRHSLCQFVLRPPFAHELLHQ